MSTSVVVAVVSKHGL